MKRNEVIFCPQLFCKNCAYELYRERYSKAVCRKTTYDKKGKEMQGIIDDRVIRGRPRRR